MKHVYIIAEAGVNHNGSLENAKKLVLAAKNAGVDAVKFQTFNTDNLVTKNAVKADYQVNNTGNNDSQYEMLKKLELSQQDYRELKQLCDELDIEFMSTPFDIESIEQLEQLNVNRFKLPSGEITNYPYLVRLAKTHKPVIMSSGMATVEDIESTIRVLKGNGLEDLSLLHCTTEYPAPFEEVNLKAMEYLKNKFGLKIGYSDHTKGIEVPIAAVAMGAEIIEKHFTLDKNMEGPDHKASLEPDELLMMVKAIRNVELAIGDGVKRPSKSEVKNKAIARKSIVAQKRILKGEAFTENNLTTKRPGTGISPMLWNEVIGQVAKKTFEVDELITL